MVLANVLSHHVWAGRGGKGASGRLMIKVMKIPWPLYALSFSP